nr:MAG TPA: hypothetical protein [Caudoviricetes sp.]
MQGRAGRLGMAFTPLYIFSHLNHIIIFRAKQYRLSTVLVPG